MFTKLTNKVKAIFDDKKTVLAMVLFWIVPWFLAGLNLWGIFFTCLGLLLGLFEWISVKTKGETLSEEFWNYMAQNKKGGIAILISITIGYILLIIHLLGF